VQTCLLMPGVVRVQFRFPECDKLPPPVLPFVDVSFSYSGKEEDMLYKNLEFGIDCDSRVALVGPNGAGKSTLIKLMAGDLTATRGTINRHAHLSIGRYHQHSVDQLDENSMVLEFFQRTWPNTATFSRDVDEWRAFIGRYGISGKMQTTKVRRTKAGSHQGRRGKGTPPAAPVKTA
jgi:ATP-binding cassette subfamily F protein 2